MKLALLFICLIGAAGAFADPDPRREALESALTRVQQEQQSVYQQFQMSQELRRIELQDAPTAITPGYPLMGADSARTLDYEQNQRIQREKQERLQAYERQLGLSYSRFLELENRKQEILQQIVELSLSPPPALPANAGAAPPPPADASRPYGNADGRR